MIPSQLIDRIMQAANIVEVVSDFMPLKKRGANYWGLSPFKAENTPSFSVSEHKGIFKDFSSGAGGNVVTYLMEAQGMNYPEALKYLAQKYGIEWVDSNGQSGKAESDRIESLITVNKFAARWFTERLYNSEEGRAGLEYINARGITAESASLFGLGYSPNGWLAFTEDAIRRGHNPELLIELGLTAKSEQTGKQYDRFRGRVIFPLHDAFGRIIGFAGRILNSEANAAKYVNSPESVLYDKSSFLYGLYFAKQAIREQGAILVEGYTDVIGLYQAGIKNVVASSGTSLTESQIRLLQRHTDRVTVMFDGDTAGQQASVRGIKLLVAAGLQVKALRLPGAHDPDTFVREFGAAGFADYARANARDIVGYLMEGKALNDPQVKIGVVNEVADAIALMPSEVDRSVYAQSAADRLGVAPHLLCKWALPAPAPAPAPEPPALIQPAEADVLRIILQFGDNALALGTGQPLLIALGLEHTEGLFVSEAATRLRAAIEDMANDMPSCGLLQAALAHPDSLVRDTARLVMGEDRALSQRWDKGPRVLDDNPAKVLELAILRLKLNRVKALVNENNQLLAAAKNDTDINRLLNATMALNATKRELERTIQAD